MPTRTSWLLVLGLAACGSGDRTPASPLETENVPDDPIHGIFYPRTPWCGVRAEVDRVGNLYQRTTCADDLPSKDRSMAFVRSLGPDFKAQVAHDFDAVFQSPRVEPPESCPEGWVTFHRSYFIPEGVHGTSLPYPLCADRGGTLSSPVHDTAFQRIRRVLEQATPVPGNH